MLGFLPVLLKVVDLGAEVGQVLAEAFGAFDGFFFFLLHYFLTQEAAVFFDGLAKGGKRYRDVTNLCWCRLALGFERGKFAANGLALPQGGVILNILEGDIRVALSRDWRIFLTILTAGVVKMTAQQWNNCSHEQFSY